MGFVVNPPGRGDQGRGQVFLENGRGPGLRLRLRRPDFILNIGEKTLKAT